MTMNLKIYTISGSQNLYHWFTSDQFVKDRERNKEQQNHLAEYFHAISYLKNQVKYAQIEGAP